MRKIFKFLLDIIDKQYITVPSGTIVLSVANQNDDLALYCLTDSEEKSQERIPIFIYGTGNPIPDEDAPDPAGFIGTVNIYNGKLMWHVFVGVAEAID